MAAPSLGDFYMALYRAHPKMDQANRDFVENSTIYKKAVPDDSKLGYHLEPATQPRLESLIETFINIGTGFLISWGIWMYVVAPVFSIPSPADQAFAITAIFTVTSVARSYFWRRFFANSIHRRIHKWLAR